MLLKQVHFYGDFTVSLCVINCVPQAGTVTGADLNT